MAHKRGKADNPGAGPAASLIGIILLIFIFYVILVPPEERARILGEDNLTGNGVYPEKSNTLLSENIGRLGFVAYGGEEHAIPNIHLFESRNAQELAKFNPFEVSQTLLSDKVKDLHFTLDPQAVENVMLSFQSPIRNGILKIMLNEKYELFRGEVDSTSPAPLDIKKSQLLKENVLTFEVEWELSDLFTTQRYSFKDIKVIGDIMDITSQRASNTFVLSGEEFNNLESARLSFFVECLQSNVGNMDVILNGRSVFSAVPVCEGLNRIDLFNQDFVKDRNRLLFVLDSGAVFIESIRLNTKLAPTKPFVGYFFIDDDLYIDAKNDNRDILLKIRFVDDGKRKEAKVKINGIDILIDQKDAEYENVINEYITQDNNYIELIPLEELNIVDLTVTYK